MGRQPTLWRPSQASRGDPELTRDSRRSPWEPGNKGLIYSVNHCVGYATSPPSVTFHGLAVLYE